MKSTIFAVIVLCLLSTAALAQVSAANSVAYTLGTTPGHLCNCPAGDGQPIINSNAGLIRLQIHDAAGNPITTLGGGDFEVDGITPLAVSDLYFPAQGHRNYYQDHVTQVAPGVYDLTGPIYAGGFDAGLCNVKVQGVAIPQALPLSISMNSPDINGDGIINLADLQIFVANLGTPTFSCDFNGDGQVNLADVVLFVPHYGHSMPPGTAIDQVD